MVLTSRAVRVLNYSQPFVVGVYVERLLGRSPTPGCFHSISPPAHLPGLGATAGTRGNLRGYTDRLPGSLGSALGYPCYLADGLRSAGCALQSDYDTLDAECRLNPRNSVCLRFGGHLEDSS